MRVIEKAITSHFERRPKTASNYKGSGKIPASKLYLAVGCDTKEELKKYLKGVHKPISKRQERIFNLGHKIEELVLLDMGAAEDFNIENKQRLLENYFLKGYIDCTVYDCVSNKMYIADIKSMNDAFYSSFIKGIVPHYIQVQMMCYVYLWKSTINLDIESDAIVIGYNKNDSRVKAILVKYDDNFINSFIQEAENIFLNNKGVKT